MACSGCRRLAGSSESRRDELLASAQGKTTPTFQILDLDDGLPSVEFPDSNQPICARDSRGRLWFATSRGVATVDPARFALNDAPPLVHVETFGYCRLTRGRRSEPATLRQPEGGRSLEDRPVRGTATFAGG